MKILFAFIFLQFITVFCDEGIWPAMIDKTIPCYETYVVKVSIGVPQKTYKLQVSFSHDEIIMYRRLDTLSVEYSPDYGGSDVLNVYGKKYRVPITLDPGKSVTIQGNPCQNCDGILGMSESSVIWKIWPDIGFSRGFFALGHLHKEFSLHDDATTTAIRCHGFQIEGSLCKTMANVSFGDTQYEVPVEFKLEDHNLNLPENIYASFIAGKNIYTDNPKKWPKIHFHILAQKGEDFQENSWQYEKFDIEINEISNEMKFSLNPSDFLKNMINGGKQFNIVPHSGQSIQIGTQIFREYIFHRNAFSNTMVVQAIHTEDFLAFENLIFILVIVCLLVFWRITDLQQMTFPKDEVYIRNTPVNLVLEILGVLMSIVTYFFPSSLQIVKDYVIVYVFAGIVFGVALYLKIVSILTSPSLRRDLNLERHLNIEKSNSTRGFENRMIRSFSQEVLLLTAFWLLLAQRRIATLSTVLVLLVSVYMIYVSSFYSVLIIVYIFQLYVKKKPFSVHIRLSLAFAVLVGFFQALVTVNFFYPPFLTPNTTAYVQLLIPSLLFLYLFIVALAVYMVRLYINKWKVTIERYKMIQKEEKTEKLNSDIRRKMIMNHQQ